MTDAPKPIVLLINCFPPEREWQLKALFDAGFTVNTCKVDEVFDAAARLRPDVVVTDIEQSDSAACIELIRRLRSDERTREAYIIVVNALAVPIYRQQAEEAGTDVVLIKPCRPAVLTRAMRHVAAAVRGETSDYQRQVKRFEALQAQAEILAKQIEDARATAEAAEEQLRHIRADNRMPLPLGARSTSTRLP